MLLSCTFLASLRYELMLSRVLPALLREAQKEGSAVRRYGFRNTEKEWLLLSRTATNSAINGLGEWKGTGDRSFDQNLLTN